MFLLLFFACIAVGHFTFESVLEGGWVGARSDENINSGIIFIFDTVCMGSPVIVMIQKGKQQV